EGRVWGVILVATRGLTPFPARAEERLAAFTDLIATAIANAESKSELAASRRRIVTAADEARRRIERDLHDPIQQRLIALRFDVQRLGGDVSEQDTTTGRRPRKARRRAGVRARGAQRGVARDPSAPAVEGRPAGAAQDARASVAYPSRAEGIDGTATAGAGRGRGLLRHLRGAHERHQVLAGRLHLHRCRGLRRYVADRRSRRRRRRRERQPRQRPDRLARPRRGTQWKTGPRQPRR